VKQQAKSRSIDSLVASSGIEPELATLPMESTI
jgi:hypothetical protein